MGKVTDGTARREDASRDFKCLLCFAVLQPEFETFKAHFKLKHQFADDDEIEKVFQDELTAYQSEDGLNLAGDETTSSRLGSNKLRSPPASVTRQCGSRGSSPPTPGRSRAQPSERDDDFVGSNKNPPRRRLWPGDDDGKQAVLKRPRAAQHHAQPQSPSENTVSELFREPDTRPISSDQLAAEVQGIYAGLVLLENKCIEYDNSQINAELSTEQYHALISLHRSLLHEHHDFLLASQHPSASDALKRLASDHRMPARMWHHGIQKFLELLRGKTANDAIEHRITFIHIAYQMMALLYETVPAFKDTWVECLGDLGRYRMAVEDDNTRDREIWTGVSKYWYTKASDKAPTTGRLYHHLAILARPNALQQLYFYAKSLCAPIPFLDTRKSIMTLFQPLLMPSPNTVQRLDPVVAAFVRVHGIIFSGKHEDQLEPSMKQFLDLLDSCIGREHGNWLESGYYIGISLSCLLLGFGDESNVLMRAISKRNCKVSDIMMDDDNPEANTRASATFKTSVSFAARTFEIVIACWGDKNTLPCLHTLLVFYWFMMDFDAGKQYLEDLLPWEQTALLLNYLLRTSEVAPRLDTDEIPWPEGGIAHPLPEDYAMRGLIYTENYYPKNWFNNTAIDDDEKYLEPASTVGKRSERILWLGHSIALKRRNLFWDKHAEQFSTKSNEIDVRQNEVDSPKQGVLEPAVASTETEAP